MQFPVESCLRGLNLVNNAPGRSNGHLKLEGLRWARAGLTYG
ncbi:hypothetical protein E2C01_094180 [Portunus trituberculatus]|uniref:Uncharacterized protein n=1 Tax=Portunus trituberculatus TaxID=210409 RepID=A0A5B7K0X3_PORTR|nr:hypothetical protein [Portunus trituberculatus]